MYRKRIEREREVKLLKKGLKQKIEKERSKQRKLESKSFSDGQADLKKGFPVQISYILN